MKTIYQAVIFILITSIAGCVSGCVSGGMSGGISSQSNMSASNDEDQDIGIGGTGMLASSGNSEESGLGGTGIVGVITGFGSVFVNGIEVEYNTKTPFSINGNKSPFLQLKIGDIVEILTTDGKNHTDAKIINLRHEVVGRVESVNRKTHSFKILGQTILQTKNRGLPEIDSDIAVAGFRINNQTIQATRLSTAKGQSTLLRTGRELPFINQTTRWLIQTHVKNGKVALSVSGKRQNILLPDKNKKDVSPPSAIKIIHLQKSNNTDDIIFTKEVDGLRIHRGSRTETPAIQSNQQFQRRFPAKQFQLKSPVMRR